MGPRLWLLVPAALFYAGDVGLTLLGQPAAYWAGDYGAAVEVNPVVYPLLVRSPWLFVGVAAVWLAALSVAVARWRHPFTAGAAVLVAAAHTVGGASWVARSGSWGLVAAVAYVVVAVLISTRCWRRYTRGVGATAEPGAAPDR